MFKITCFAPVEPEQLEKALKGIHFKTVKNGFEWRMDGNTVSPYSNNAYKNSSTSWYDQRINLRRCFFICRSKNSQSSPLHYIPKTKILLHQIQ
ncbi:hypothetical protein FAY30_26290 (plasmid) [Bacillus sp. S3]|nr:hypothetical protein FAY30_26290 [Bacillus sp. S3]